MVIYTVHAPGWRHGAQTVVAQLPAWTNMLPQGRTETAQGVAAGAKALFGTLNGIATLALCPPPRCSTTTPATGFYESENE